MNFWLCKSEPETYSISDLARDISTDWGGVRNYQARNNLKAMQVGDVIFFYHSNAKPSGLAGLARVVKQAYPEPDQFKKTAEYFDPKALKEKPLWFSPDFEFVEEFSEVISLAELKSNPKLSNLAIVKAGTRLSVVPVSKAEARELLKLAKSSLKEG